MTKILDDAPLKSHIFQMKGPRFINTRTGEITDMRTGEQLQKPNYELYKDEILSIKAVEIAPIDDFMLYPPVLQVFWWRIRFHFRPWKPFYLRFLFLTEKRLKDVFENMGMGYGYPPHLEITIGKWRNVRYRK